MTNDAPSGQGDVRSEPDARLVGDAGAGAARLVVIGDVGVLDGMVHIGDEAMFEEFVEQMRARGVTRITALSSNPAETEERYGVDAVLNVGFAPGLVGGRDGQRARMERVLATASAAAAGAPAPSDALAPDDSAHAVIAAVRDASGVAIAGGGNMASIWPLHIFERATLAGLARIFGKPLVVSGQTIGPELTGEDRDLVAELLSSAALVGLRESASYTLVESLGVDPRLLTATIDDASFVGASSVGAGSSEPRSESEGDEDARPSLVVSLASHVGDADRGLFVPAVASLLDALASESGLGVTFLAHFGSLTPGDERGDSVMHRAVIDAMTTTDVAVVTPTDSPAAARLARSAALVVTSRYHPAVFAVAGGVPTVGIAVDDYTTVKLTGALGNFGQSSVVSAAAVIDGSAVDVALGAWRVAATTRASWQDRIGDARATSSAWWDRVAAALRP
ncbi:polysaccharide pyruvyl transferase family protein [Frondihabitans cladoniiphilus]